jgi:hypothetical protein
MESNEIFAALSRFQGLCPTINKGKTVNVGKYKFSYADLASIWSAIRAPLAECGLSVVQMIESDAEGRPCIVTIIGHTSGKSIRSSLIIDYMGRDIKEAGGAITYYRRYTLSAALGIVSDDDADDNPEHSPPKREHNRSAPVSAPVIDEPPPHPLVSADQVGRMLAAAVGHADLIQEACTRLKIDDLSQMRERHYAKCMQWLEGEVATRKEGPCNT